MGTLALSLTSANLGWSYHSIVRRGYLIDLADADPCVNCGCRPAKTMTVRPGAGHETNFLHRLSSFLCAEGRVRMQVNCGI